MGLGRLVRSAVATAALSYATLQMTPLDAQSNGAEKDRPVIYELSARKGIFSHDFGSIVIKEGYAQVTLDGLSKLLFEERGDRYVETVTDDEKTERYIYAQDSAGSRTLLMYYALPQEKTRVDKSRKATEKFSSTASSPTELYDILSTLAIPDTIRMLTFAFDYVMVKENVRRTSDGAIVEMRIANMVVFPEDKEYLDGPITFYLQRDAKGKYSPIGAKGRIAYRTALLGTIRFDVEAKIDQ